MTISTFKRMVSLGPYRLFFPLGLLCGVIGVGHWTFWSIHWIDHSSSFFHGSLQSQGFLACVAVGFLLTSLPRFMGVGEATFGEVMTAFFFSACFLITSLLTYWRASQAFFLLVLLTVFVFGARRVPVRTKEHPSSMLLFDFGFLHAFIGTLLILCTNLGERSASLYMLGRQMVQLGFLLCLVLAMAAFITPYIMGYTGEPGRNSRHKSVHIATGLFLLASFPLEMFHQQSAYVMRALVATIHLLWMARIAHRSLKKVLYVYFFQTACWMIVVGLWFVGLIPAYRVAGLHIIFIGGFSLMIVAFGTLVVLSHTSVAGLVNKPMPLLKWAGGMILLALAFRVTADFWPDLYIHFLHSASGFWLTGAILWLILIWPKLWMVPPFLKELEEKV